MLRILCSFLTFVLLISVSEVDGQAPALINYQAVARNTQTGTELSDQDIFLSAEIRQNGPSGSIVYQESHTSVSTDNFGLFNIMIGGGSPVAGSFAEIQWATSTFWLVINIDAGAGLESAGAMQMLSVPYALHAKTATDVDDADADPTNELVQDLVFNVENSTLTILQEGDNNPFVNLQPLIAGLDASDTNELVDGLELNPETSVLTLLQPGSNNPAVDLSPVINDALIQNGWPVLLENNILQIRQGSTDHEVDLGILASDGDWQINPDPGYVFNTTDQIGIGTNTPSSRLEIKGLQDDTSLLKVVNSEDIELLSVGENNIGIGGNIGGSKIQISGSVGYNFVNLEPPFTGVYNVTDEDYLIIAHPTSFSAIVVNLPDPETCIGRKIIVKKIANGLLSSILTIDTGGANIDLVPQNDVITGTQSTVRAYMSIGEQGWVRIISN